MRKRAILESAIEGYDKLKQNPLGAVGLSVASLTPAGAAIHAADAASNLHKGNLAGAALSTGLAGIHAIPGGGLVAKGVGSLLGGGSKAVAAGQAAAKAVDVMKAPKTMGQVAANLGANVGGQALAQSYDQSQAVKRPAIQKQLADQQRELQEFKEWQSHKNYLQSLNGEPKVAADGLGLWSGVKSVGKAVPYIAAPALAAAALQEIGAGPINDVGQLAGLGAGALGGKYLGGLAGHHLGMNPMVSKLLGATGGGLLGAHMGHQLSRRATKALGIPETEETLKIGASLAGMDKGLAGIAKGIGTRIGDWTNQLAGAVAPKSFEKFYPPNVPGSPAAGKTFFKKLPEPEGLIGGAIHEGRRGLSGGLQNLSEKMWSHPMLTGAAAVGLPAAALAYLYASGRSKRQAEDEAALRSTTSI